jgi:DNA-binding CsgD family transcriptional regulator
LASGDVEMAETSAACIADVAASTSAALHRAQADFAAGKIALALGHADAATPLRSAALSFARAGAALPACRARFALAHSLIPQDADLAVIEARSALVAFDRMGATAEADKAAALLRQLGVRGRTGPRTAGLLSNREREVLALVADGMSNAEIAQRLYISTKTAGHHVSSILGKLGVRSRTEAVAFALLNLPSSPSVDDRR